MDKPGPKGKRREEAKRVFRGKRDRSRKGTMAKREQHKQYQCLPPQYNISHQTFRVNHGSTHVVCGLIAISCGRDTEEDYRVVTKDVS